MEEHKCECCYEIVWTPVKIKEKELCWGCYDEYSSIFLGKKIFANYEVENES